ncbi:MAG: DegV family protein, partial [Acetivibrio ethanolgignens]
MKKIAVVTDSNSGITQAQGKELGVFVLPMPFTINGKEYFEDINLTQEEFYQML